MERNQNFTTSLVKGSLENFYGNEEAVPTHQDILTRRLKNRERQRRYRARKRLEAETSKTYTTNLSTPLQEVPVGVTSDQSQLQEVPINCTTHQNGLQGELPLSGPPLDVVTRVRCRRDWKKDARRASVLKELEVIPVGSETANGEVSHVQKDPTLDNRHVSCSSIIESNETRKFMPSRRDWKAEARNKKD